MRLRRRLPLSNACIVCFNTVNIPLRASTLSPILDLPESITKLPITVVALPPTDEDHTDEDIALPPTVEHLSRDEQHKVGGGGGLGPGLNQDTAPSMPSSTPAKSHHGQTLDNNDDPFYRCAANRLCRSMGNQTSQILMCINCNQPVHLFCAEYLIRNTTAVVAGQIKCPCGERILLP